MGEGGSRDSSSFHATETEDRLEYIPYTYIYTYSVIFYNELSRSVVNLAKFLAICFKMEDLCHCGDPSVVELVTSERNEFAIATHF